MVTLGIAYPYALVLREHWKANHTYINGRQLKFIGTATGLFFTWLKRLVPTMAALGICLFWVMPRLNKWIVEHTGFARPEPQTSGDSSVQSHHT